MVGPDSTYRVVVLGGDRDITGQTADTPELAKLVPPDVDRSKFRLGVERTDWDEHFGKPRAVRTVLIEAETKPNEWKVGV